MRTQRSAAMHCGDSFDDLGGWHQRVLGNSRYWRKSWPNFDHRVHYNSAVYKFTVSRFFHLRAVISCSHSSTLISVSTPPRYPAYIYRSLRFNPVDDAPRLAAAAACAAARRWAAPSDRRTWLSGLDTPGSALSLRDCGPGRRGRTPGETQCVRHNTRDGYLAWYSDTKACQLANVLAVRCVAV